MKTLALVSVVALVSGGATLAVAQHGHHSHGQPGADHSPIACEQQFEQVVADGRGFGMAFAADRNGYPGPLHVLELAGRLGLTPEQETRVRALMDRMFAASRPKGAELLAAERRLTALFTSGRPDDASIRAAVADVERLRAELRTLHLTTHVATRDLLTEPQRRAYHAARWAGH